MLMPAFRQTYRTSLLVIVLCSLGFNGCAYIIASRQAERAKVARTALLIGSRRTEIIKSVGQPRTTVNNGGNITDIFLVSRAGLEGEPSAKEGGFVIITMLLDPILVPLQLYADRDASKCEYRVIYDKDLRAKEIQCSYPQGFDPGLCSLASAPVGSSCLERE